MTTIVVIAKECLPGRVKTRLTPYFTPEEAAALARASLHDTLEKAGRLPASRRVLAWAGENPPVGAGWDVVPQAPGGLDERLAAVFDACAGPTVLIGMDSPQFEPDDLAPLFGRWPEGVGAAIGLSTDGGFWALGMARPDGALIRGVPMSADDTGAVQLARLHAAGLRVHRLRELTDIDTPPDAFEVAELFPGGRFSARLAELRRLPEVIR
jgi:uncharacterized protein